VAKRWFILALPALLIASMYGRFDIGPGGSGFRSAIWLRSEPIGSAGA
jgi:hypothetical protein